MLTADLALSWRRGRSTGPRSIDAGDANYVRVAEALIDIVAEHKGRTRAELESALDEFVGVGTDYKILRGLIKLIMDRCLFETTGAIDPVEIRRALFSAARSHHPVTELTRGQIIAETARQLGCAPEELSGNLYADLSENQRLIDFEQIEPAQLIDQYNLAQAQALLYRSVEMELAIEPQEPQSLRRLFGAIKAYRLIHTIKGAPERGYQVRLSGPLSVFHRSQKYGVQMAVFLPALLACKGWSMRAEIGLKGGGSAFFELSSRTSKLNACSPVDALAEGPSENPLIAKLLASWAKAGSDWSLERCREVISLGESAFIPDLVMRRADGEQVYMELLGFWTPRYLEQRLKQFERGGFGNFILAASEELRGSREASAKWPSNVIIYKSSLSVEAVTRSLKELGL